MPESFYAKITPVSPPDGPVDPDYGHPAWGGGRPDNELPSGPAYIWGTLAKWLLGPHIGGGPAKPPGIPILPIDPGWGVGPIGPPSGPGDWVPVDPGWGKPPIWGFLPVDPGWGVGGGGGGTLPTDPPGHWVPVDPGYGRPVGPCGGGEKPPHVWGKPLWVYIFEIGPGFGKPTPEPKK